MQTYRIFDCTEITSQPDDILIFGPRWLAQLLAWAKGPHWDYQAERLYQLHYERAQQWESDDDNPAFKV